MKKFLRIFIIFSAAFLSALVLFVPLMSRFFLTGVAARKAHDLLQTKVEIANAEFQFLEGGVVVRGVRVYHPDRPSEKVIEIDRVAIRFKPWPMIFGDLAGFEMEMDGPKLVYATTKTGAWELSKRFPLLRRGEGEMRLPVNIDEIKIKNGEVDYQDGKVGMTTKVSDIDLDVTHVRLPTPQKRLPARFELSFEIGRSADFSMKGDADFLSPKISFDADMKLTGLPLPPYAPYYDKGLPVRITQGSMAMTSRAKCENDMLRAPAHVVISGLRVEPKQAKIFGFASNTVVSALKDRKGGLELDMMITGNIRNPQFHVMTHLSTAFIEQMSKGLLMVVPNQISETVQGVGKGVKKGTESGFGKLKGLFKK